MHKTQTNENKQNYFSGYIRHEGVFFRPRTPSGLMCGILNSKKQAQMMNVSTIDGQIIPKKRINFNYGQKGKNMSGSSM